MSLKLGNTTIAGISRETKLNAHSLLDFKWTDHILNEMSWLRADTFSWQSGDVYTSVYNLLVSEYQNGTEETEGSITFKRSANGYKITTDESGVSALFNDTGVAWYYILDVENRRFKLPRSKYNAYASQIAARGNGKALGFTDGEHEVMLRRASDTQSANMTSYFNYNLPFATNVTSGVSSNFIIGINTDTEKSGIVADLPTQELYLYFYVGEFSQTATEQTAGLNTELFNSKADTTLSNIDANIDYVVENYENGASGYKIWKSGYCEQWGVITSSSTATVPITFVKEFATNPNVICNTFANGTSSGNWYGYPIQNTLTTKGCSFSVLNYNGTNWIARGHLAEGEY